MIKIKTGLKTELQMDVLKSVLGQLSDGIWENSPRMQKYWRCSDIEMIDGEVVLTTDEYCYACWKSYNKNIAKDILKWWANKVKEVVKIEINDGYGERKEWNRNCKVELEYMCRHTYPSNPNDEKIKVCDAYEVYDILLGRK